MHGTAPNTFTLTITSWDVHYLNVLTRDSVILPAICMDHGPLAGKKQHLKLNNMYENYNQPDLICRPVSFCIQLVQ